MEPSEPNINIWQITEQSVDITKDKSHKFLHHLIAHMKAKDFCELHRSESLGTYYRVAVSNVLPVPYAWTEFLQKMWEL